MDASFDHHSPLREIVPGRFTRVSVQTPAGEIEARLSERGNWELRVRRDQEMNWRLACTGDLDCGIVTAQPVAAVQEEVITLGALMVDPAGRRVTVGGKEVTLARKEFALLLVLAAQPDRVFSKEELLATVWGHTGTTHTRTLDSHASRLRRRLHAGGAPGLIVNTRGIGYRLRDRPDLAALPALGPASKVLEAPGSLPGVV